MTRLLFVTVGISLCEIIERMFLVYKETYNV